MKVKHLFLVLCATAFTFTGCSNDGVIGNGETTETTSTSAPTEVQMVVPVGCKAVRIDYRNASGVKSINANINPVAKVVSGREVSSITTATVSIASPVSTYVNIYDENGNLLVENKAIPATNMAAAQKAGASNVQLPEDAVKQYVTADGPYVFYHSSGVAMFDDSWPLAPKVGAVDADFNDVVIDYDIEDKAVEGSTAIDETYRECVKVVMHVRAIGGGFPAKAGLYLEGLDQKYIKSVETKVTLGNWNTDIPKNSLSCTVDTTGDHPNILINNIGWLITTGATTATYTNSKTGKTQIINDQHGASNVYYNVSKGYVNTGGDLFTVTVIFKGNLRSGMSKADGDAQLANFKNAVINTESQNFYIVTHAGTEIHMKGYQPTPDYKTYSADAAKGVTMNNATTYCTSDGLVWGFKTPVLTRHAWEKSSFYLAYPTYKDFLASNGTTNKDWYVNPDGRYISDWW